MSDLIDRQAVIEEIARRDTTNGTIKVYSGREVIEILRSLPSVQPERELIEQLRWERDTAIQQLKNLGYGLGEKPRTDDTISRQDAIDVVRKYYDREDYSTESIEDRLKRLPSVQPEIRYYGQFEIKDPILISEQQWIPCSERLPEIGQSVLLSVGGMYSAEGCLREDGDWAQFRWDAIQRKDMVGAWKPLPEPYKGEQE